MFYNHQISVHITPLTVGEIEPLWRIRILSCFFKDVLKLVLARYVCLIYRDLAKLTVAPKLEVVRKDILWKEATR